MHLKVAPTSGARGRFAPSPTGLLHVGSARTALAAWLSVRQQGGTFVWRIEDLDPPRVVAGMIEAALEDMAWLGMDWDEGPDAHESSRQRGPHAPYHQSARAALYDQALARLAAGGHLFPCSLSRSDLLTLASAPHGDGGLPPYPAALRPTLLAANWYAEYRAGAMPDCALRFPAHDRPVQFHDRILGPQTERVDQTCGDFVLKRRDGIFAYQLAVVVDDLEMGITEVVRGQDLLDSTGRQIQLIQALDGRPPDYAHLPLVVNAAGEKLSKRDAGMTLRELRQRGAEPEAVVGYLGGSLGIPGVPRLASPGDLVEAFHWDRIPRDPWTVPDDLPARLAR